MKLLRVRSAKAWPVLAWPTLVVLAATLWGVSAQPASAATTSFGFTGAEQAYTVPAGVRAIHVVAIGARGGKGGDEDSTLGGPGGFGDRVEADLAVMPGQVLFVAVGGVGGDASPESSGAAGGFNGGGSSGNVLHDGGGGGGATDLRTCSRNDAVCGALASLESRLLVAGGGGGGGAAGGGRGGDARGNGESGRQHVQCGAVTAGGGGLAGSGTAGGAGGAAGSDGAAAGLAGIFGAGGASQEGVLTFQGGGGGGGGYFGGGAGGSANSCTAGGGGGGSSFAAASVSNVSMTVASTEPPSVTISTPSSDFRVGRLSLNKRRGSAVLAVRLPGPGKLSLQGKGLVKRQRSLRRAGTVKLAVKAKGSTARRLVRRGTVKLKARLTYTPTGADPNSLTRTIRLIKD